MLTRIVASLLATLAMVAHAAPVTTAPRPAVHASRVHFSQVTRVRECYLLGDYVVVHDDDKMSRGEPCTTFYRLNPSGPEAVVSFHCIPRERAAVEEITLTVRPSTTTTTRSVELVEYQIGGETEAHGVPGLAR